MKIIIKTIHDTYTINILELTISINDIIIKIAEKENEKKQNISVLYNNKMITYSEQNDQKFIDDDCSLFVIIKKI
jgi:hypothetical protein